MTETLHHLSGGVTFPVVAADVENDQLFSAFDPARDRLLALLQTALNAEIGPAWAVASVGTSLASKDPVQSTFHDHILPFLAKEQVFDFPLLSLYRVSANHSEFTLWKEQIVTTWALEYVMPPLTPADARKLMGAMDAVERLVPIILSRGASHPAYESDEIQREAIGLSGVEVERTERGLWQTAPGEGVPYSVLQLVIETTEFSTPLDTDAVPFDGVSIAIGVGGAIEVLPELVLVDTSAPP